MDLKDIQSLMKLCRKYGVMTFDSPNLTMKFGDLPKPIVEGDKENNTSDEMTDEDLAFFSAGGP